MPPDSKKAPKPADEKKAAKQARKQAALAKKTTRSTKRSGALDDEPDIESIMRDLAARDAERDARRTAVVVEPCSQPGAVVCFSNLNAWLRLPAFRVISEDGVWAAVILLCAHEKNILSKKVRF